MAMRRAGHCMSSTSRWYRSLGAISCVAQSENGWVPAQASASPSPSATGATSASVASRSARASATVGQIPVTSSRFDSISSFLAFGWGSPRAFSSRRRISLAPLRSSRDRRSMSCSSTSTPRVERSEAWKRMSMGLTFSYADRPGNALRRRSAVKRSGPSKYQPFICPKHLGDTLETVCRKSDPRFGRDEGEGKDGGKYRLGAGVGGAGAVHDPGAGLLLWRHGPIQKRTRDAHAELLLHGTRQRAVGAVLVLPGLRGHGQVHRRLRLR